MPLDAIDAQYGPDEAPVADVVPLEVVRAVMGRLSWQRSLDDVDVKALTEGVETHEGPILQALALERANGGDVTSLRERIRALVKE